jgi:hypothetical protein
MRRSPAIRPVMLEEPAMSGPELPASLRRVESVMNEDLLYDLTYPQTDGGPFIVDAILKVQHGVRFLCESWPERPIPALITHRCARYGEFSARPYLLGQATDDSTLHCVLGLFYDFCRRHTLDATQLTLRAYPGGEGAAHWDTASWRRVLDLAQWQGTRFPDTWTSQATLGLLLSLRSQGRIHLAQVLAEQLNLVPLRPPDRNA